ncbi:MAG: hemopexin repeat-containing protein [Smithellaceae bacterium]|nr:DUF2380 domain-containing protein [Syntrophaceae bacterium]MDD4242233.1 hemopexin repeat-containing protein [Smithellaceae bacterium]NLX52995.1 DUF2380 domain-containing protein [Deltaproteobacteria bacterium]
MKLKYLLIHLTAFALIAAAVAGFAADKKSSVAVLDFESVGAEEHLGKAVAEIIRTELVDAKKFRVVERSQINKALTEQRFQQSGVIDEKSATAIGKLLGADLIVIGSVVKIGSSYTINSRMIDVGTGEATLGKNVTGNDLHQLAGMSRTLLGKLFGEPETRAASRTSPPPPPAVHQPQAKSRATQRFAVVNWGNGKAYFFRGNQYVRYDIAADRVDPGYPKPMNDRTWPGMTWADGIDAAVNWGNGKAYFFRGGQYLRYDIAADGVDPGYPKPINDRTWPGMTWTGGIDDVVLWSGKKAVFFKGDQFIQYDIIADRADPGYPKIIDAQIWPGLQW